MVDEKFCKIMRAENFAKYVPVNTAPMKTNKQPKLNNEILQLLPTKTPKSRRPPLFFSILIVGGGHC